VFEALNVDVVVQKRIIADLLANGQPYFLDKGWKQIDYARYYAELELCISILPAIAALGAPAAEDEVRNRVMTEYDDGSTVVFG